VIVILVDLLVQTIYLAAASKLRRIIGSSARMRVANRMSAGPMMRLAGVLAARD
jgi:threonine/homoserine/homoserine lactone efflux protein